MKYYIDRNGNQIGPFSVATIEAMLRDGAISEETLVWQEGWQEWRPYRTIRRKVNTMPTKPSITDRFLSFNFRFGKIFAALMAAIFLFGFVVSLTVFLFQSRSSIRIPTFQDLRHDQSDNQASDDSGASSQLDDRRLIEKQYGDKLAELVKKYGFQESSYDVMLKNLTRTPKHFRNDYVSGLESALKKAKEANDKNPSQVLAFPLIANRFNDAFQIALSNAQLEKAASNVTRWTALASAGGCCMATFLMLIIPALLKIEENTRKIEENIRMNQA